MRLKNNHSRMRRIFIGRWLYGSGKFLRMGTTELIKTPAERKREEVLYFWKRHGLAAAMDHSGNSRSTLYEWRKLQKQGQLSPQSKRPRRVRQAKYSSEAVEKIRSIRLAVGYGKEKIAVILKRDSETISASTVGRIIKKYQLPKPVRQDRRIPGTHSVKRLRKPKDIKAKRVGQIVGLDTIVLNYFGVRLYIIVAIDWFSRIAIARAYNNPSSKNAADLLQRMQLILGTKIESVNTYNGSEFLKHFILACEKLQILHFFNYPRCPKMNAITERFNRTLQEEALFPDRNASLAVWNKYLNHFIFQYNFFRPHKALDFRTPIEIFLQPHSSSMYWTHTHSSFSASNPVSFLHLF